MTAADMAFYRCKPLSCTIGSYPFISAVVPKSFKLKTNENLKHVMIVINFEGLKAVVIGCRDQVVQCIRDKYEEDVYEVSNSIEQAIGFVTKHELLRYYGSRFDGVRANYFNLYDGGY
jgi:hypothetical protein